ncbi:hypothetical protein [Nocardioides sp. YIM 152315]|uniref:hypothetical protein n=1 Tax=Nocardioides sp. YIM 152315 TaxID=3031760 RepID=UPI0023DC0E93|nr:hypothetical protein [Nocardioides sp. YIM 152315]MDF1605014.1 hypothetical protein [Nocardioides sp. YIM 152315]
MPRKAHMTPPRFDPARPRLVRPVPVEPQGLRGPTRGQARGPHWRRTSCGYYVPADVDGDLVEQRIVEAGHHVSPDTAVTGWASLRWQGATWFDGLGGDGRTPLAVQLTSIRRSVREQPGIAVTGECIPPPFRTVVDGLQVVVPVSAVAFEMRYADHLVAAVRAFDMAAAADLVSCAELLRHLELLYHWTGIPVAREAAALADENAWSPREVDVRLVWPLVLALEPPLTNRPVFDLEGRHLGTPDLLDVEAGLAVEYDGGLHLEGRQRAKDLVRADDLRRAGLEYLDLVGADVREPLRLERRIREARGRALASRPGERRWTLELPGWWTPTHTVDLRRALSDDQRERLLRYRRAG